MDLNPIEDSYPLMDPWSNKQPSINVLEPETDLVKLDFQILTEVGI